MFNGVLTDPFHIFALYVALNAGLLVVLGVLVSGVRSRTGIGIGDGGNPVLARRIRAHANGTEHTPMALVMLWALIPLGAPALLIHAVGLPLTLGRFAHAFGLSQSEGPSLPRLAGAVLTILAYVIGVVALLWLVFVPAAVVS